MSVVLLIEDDAAVRESITAALRMTGYEVQAFDSASAFELMHLPARPAVVVTDMHMPGLLGVELQALLAQRERRLPFIFISGKSAGPEIIRAMKQGAIEFLLKPFDLDTLLQAIARGLEIDARQIQEIQFRNALNARLQKLSPRERQVFKLLLGGASNAEIQQELSISLPTAKEYKAEVMRKLGVTKLSELMNIAKQLESEFNLG